MKKTIIAGAKFGKKTVFRPTAMSIAMASAGIIPAPHIIAESARTATLRTPNDTNNLRKSATISL